ADEKQARRAAGQFERFRNVFQKAFNFRVDPGKPIIIVATRDENSWREIRPGDYEEKSHTKHAGYFQSGVEKHYVAVRLDAPEEQAFHTIYHEYVHMLVSLNFTSLPTWLNEGIAELYGNSVITEKEVGLGRPSAQALRLLQENKLLPLPTL